MRTPPACAKPARRHSTNGAKPRARSAVGVHVVTPHAWPRALNGSAGAPIDRPRSIASPSRHASLPAASQPTGKSAIRPIAMPRPRAARCAAASPRAACHCRKAWNAMSCACARANAATSGASGVRHAGGQRRQSAPMPLSMQHACNASNVACASSAPACRARKRANARGPASAPVGACARQRSNSRRSTRSFAGTAPGQSTSGARVSALHCAPSPASAIAARAACAPSTVSTSM